MRLFLLGLLALSLVMVRPAATHEIGDSQVVIELGEGSWSARIVTAPTAFINRLEQAEKQEPGRDFTKGTAAAKLAELSPDLPRHLNIRIDGKAVAATMVVEQLLMPADQSQPSFLVLRAEGTLPPEAGTMSWQFDLLEGQYALLLGGQVHWVEGSVATGPLSLRPGPPPTLMQVVGQYVHLGFIHIVPDGPDHVLFVLGLVLLTTRLRPLLVQVTAFTLAHCLTLALALNGVIDLPAPVVEPLIALSIAYVAVENIFAHRMTPWRPALVFGFGLLHGLGFAGVLTELGLPAKDQTAALIAFNIGIEAGQLAVIAIAYFLLLHWFKDRAWFRARITIPASALIAIVGLYWTAERVLVG
ncbi:HupE/UreJ family protein [Niveispirillum cyanobacteriorum]|nr:HupE/UreJ family protein [Niveispirillum cyanobacteriorum]